MIKDGKVEALHKLGCFHQNGYPFDVCQQLSSSLLKPEEGGPLVHPI